MALPHATTVCQAMLFLHSIESLNHSNGLNEETTTSYEGVYTMEHTVSNTISYSYSCYAESPVVVSKGKWPESGRTGKKKGSTSTTSAYLDSLTDKIDEHYIGTQANSKHNNTFHLQ